MRRSRNLSVVLAAILVLPGLMAGGALAGCLHPAGSTVHAACCMGGGATAPTRCPVARHQGPVEGSAGCGCRHHRVPAGRALPALSTGDGFQMAPLQAVSRILADGREDGPALPPALSMVPTRCEPPPVFLLDCALLI